MMQTLNHKILRRQGCTNKRIKEPVSTKASQVIDDRVVNRTMKQT